MKIFLLAGEASGDQHGSELIKDIRSAHPEWDLCAWGGDKMEAAGARLLSHYKDRNIMGLAEVIKNLRTIRGFMQQAKDDLERERPDKVVFIDNPGFNLPLAKYANSLGIEVHWYIAPKAWAWNKRRIKTMKKVIDHLYVIFPFEVEFFKKYGMPSTYVGNPTLKSVDQFLENKPSPLSHKKTIALLPGSRPAEVEALLPNFIRAAHEVEDEEIEIMVAGAPSLDLAFYNNILRREGLEANIRFNQTFDILYTASITGGYALVASGTATLETALLGCPQLVAYKVNPITYWVGKTLIGIKWVSLVNILLNRMAVQEYLQDVSVGSLVKGIKELKSDGLDEELREVFSGGNPQRMQFE
jgi:lipid-A-disaccharide synthase